MPGGRTDDPGIWLLDIEVGGHVYRYATEAVEVEDVQGREHVYLEGLSEPSVPFGSVLGVGDASVAVELVTEVDWALLVERGHALERCSATLRRWYPGRTLDRAKVVIRGLTEAPSHGAQGEALTLSIVRSMREQTASVPPPQAVVDATTWPVTALHAIPDNIIGATYTLVIGYPGDDGSALPVCVVPVPQAEWVAGTLTNKVIWLGDSVGTSVRLQRTPSAGGSPVESTVTIAAMDDLLGREVAYVLVAADDVDAEYRIGFRSASTWGGGIDYQGSTLRGAGDVIEWVLGQYDGLVDWGRLAAVKAYLNAWKIDTYINAGVNLWSWLESEVLPLLPVEMREGSLGVYPAVIRYDLTARDAVAHLDATEGSGRVQRESPVTTLADIANEITVEFRPGGESGSTWLARRVLSAEAGFLSGDDATDTTDDRVLASRLCGESQKRYGVRSIRIQAGAVWDTTTALLVAQHIAARQAWPRRVVRYSGTASLEEIEIGDCVTLTDPELHLDAAVAIVADTFPEPTGASVDIILLDHPTTRARATS